MTGLVERLRDYAHDAGPYGRHLATKAADMIKELADQCDALVVEKKRALKRAEKAEAKLAKANAKRLEARA
jgi:hypothetical protein